MTEVFCDDLRVSIPSDEWPDLHDAVMPVLDALGAFVEYASVDKSAWRFGGGTLHAKNCGAVWSLSCSGAFLAGLRASRLFGQYLAAIGSVPHTVTGLHATSDVAVDTPPVLASLLERAYSADGLRMTRKRVATRHVQRHISRREDGQDSGTVYFGGKSAEVRCVVYDKRLQMRDVAGVDIGEPRTRYELRLRSGVGLTLRDAMNPTAVFWHFMDPDFLTAPRGVPTWSAYGEPAALPPRNQFTGYERLASRVYRSDDLAKLIGLAESCGDRGIEVLCGMIRKRAADRGAGAPPAVTAFDLAADTATPAAAA